MHAEIPGYFLNGFQKPDRKDRDTGQMVQQDYIVQIQLKTQLEDGSLQLEHLDIPIDRTMAKLYQDKKAGDLVKVPCNLYGENFARIKISKAKK